MPIYGYRCSDCGHQKDVLQKMSDAPLTECPSCGAQSFTKEVSAPAFQLKGTGWYVTDFRDGNKPGGSDKPTGKETSGTPATDTAKASSGSDSSKSDSKASDSKATPAASPAPAASTSPAPATKN